VAGVGTRKASFRYGHEIFLAIVGGCTPHLVDNGFHCTVAIMSNTCDVTGAKPSFGATVSRSRRPTHEGRTVRLDGSATAIKIIERGGIGVVAAGVRAQRVNF
jgi:large subunit ribosomal protein L28